MKTISSAFLVAVTIMTAVVMAAIWDRIPAAAEVAAAEALYCLRGIGVVLLALAGVAAWWWIARAQHERLRQRDGAWPILEYNLLPWTVRVLNCLRGRPSPRLIYDPNANLSHGAIVAETIFTVEPPAGWDRQLAYMENIERTRRAQAVAPGDRAISLPWVGSPGRGAGGIPNAATGRLLAGAYDRQQKQITAAAPDAPAPALPAPRIDLEGALRQSTPARWLLGQNRDTGDLAVWAPESNPHIAVVGASGSGKTESSVMQLIVSSRLGAPAVRWHCVILDPVGGADLRVFADKAEWLETSADVFPDQLAAISALMAERRALCSAGNVARVADLPDAPRQVLVLIDEFGLLMAGMRGAALASASTALEGIVRVGRKWGVHLALCDQDKSRWPATLSDGVSPTLTYRMADYGGARTKAYDADMLAPGQFVTGRRVYDAWHVAPRLGEILAAMPRQAARMIDGVRAERSAAGNGDLPDANGSANGAERSGIGAHAPMDRESWYAWALNYMATAPGLWQSPPRGVREMARAMSRYALGDEGGEASYAGLASDLCKRVRAESNVGTDISTTEVTP